MVLRVAIKLLLNYPVDLNFDYLRKTLESIFACITNNCYLRRQLFFIGESRK